MGILIIAAVAGTLAVAGLLMAVCRMNRRPVPVTWGSPAVGQDGHHIGQRCFCGRGQLQQMWQHGHGAILGCSNYPVCRVAYQFNGRALPAAQLAEMLQIR